MVSWPESPEWQQLSQQVAPAVSRGMAQLEATCGLVPPPPAAVKAGEPDGPLWALDGEDVVLHPDLATGAVHWSGHQHLLDLGLHAIALDRWRATIGAVLEATVVRALGGLPEDPHAQAWRIGLAAHVVDTLDPHLGWTGPSAVHLLTRPEAGVLAHPRAMVWWARFSKATAVHTPWTAPALDRWTAFGAWVRDRSRGPATTLPMPVSPSTAAPWSTSFALPPLSHRPTRRGLRPSGRRWTLEGPVHPPHLPPQDADQTVVFGSVSGGDVSLAPAAGGPVGTWRLDSGGMGGQFGSARGVSLTLFSDGRASLTAADGFVGPATRNVLDMADQYGVSGSADGRWRLTGITDDHTGGTLRVSGLHAGSATVHGRGGLGFALPAEEWLTPVRQFLRMIEPVPLRWTLLDNGQKLRVSAKVLAGMELRFSRER